jgi:hypothetical protein
VFIGVSWGERKLVMLRRTPSLRVYSRAMSYPPETTHASTAATRLAALLITAIGI